MLSESLNEALVVAQVSDDPEVEQEMTVLKVYMEKAQMLLKKRTSLIEEKERLLHKSRVSNNLFKSIITIKVILKLLYYIF